MKTLIRIMVAVNIVILLGAQADAINPQPEPPVAGLPELEQRVNAIDVNISTLQLENSAQQSLINALSTDLITAQDAIDVNISALQLENSAQQSLINALSADLITAQNTIVQLSENYIAAQNMMIQLKDALVAEMRISRLRTQIQSAIDDIILGTNNRFEAALLDISSNILGNKIDSLWINEQVSFWQQIILTEDTLRAAVQQRLVNQNQMFDIVDVEAGVALVIIEDIQSEMEALEALNLQMTMDRRQKAIETLSHMMKRMWDQQDELIDNML